MITSKGISQGFVGTKILRIVDRHSINVFFENTVVVVHDSENVYFAKNVLTPLDHLQKSQCGIICLNRTFINSLHLGDVISICEDGRVNVLWQCGKDDNLLFVTDFCNSKCIMCPQTQVSKPGHYYDQALQILEIVKDTPKFLCISGGEPTFIKEKYLDVVSLINKKFPNVALQVLTNGKNFSDFDFTKNCVIASPIDSLYGIPLYSGNPSLHDEIVRTRGSFEKTVKGIINLYKLKQNIEIRVVITKQNYKDLTNIAHFIYWNMPFVFHITFMGMETHGSAYENLEEVWVEPVEYVEYLERAVSFLNDRLLNVSVYNLPHCLLPVTLRKFAKDSISAWKKTFLEPCCNCSMINVCSGVFATSYRKPKGIHRI